MGADEAAQLVAVLERLDAGARDAVGECHVGTYLKGSFALGAGDVHADVDFLVVTERALTADEERRVRALHRRLPDGDEHWAHNLEGSWATRDQVRRRAEPGVGWLYVNNGSREMEWSDHDNTEVFRWVLRNCAVTVSGPAPETLLPEVPAHVVRAEAAGLAARRAAEIDDEYLANAWGQPHEVLTQCRLLYTATTGEVTGKEAAARWCLDRLPAQWHDLILSAIADRPDPWGRVHRFGDPGRARRTHEFVGEMSSLIARAKPTTSSESSMIRVT